MSHFALKISDSAPESDSESDSDFFPIQTLNQTLKFSDLDSDSDSGSDSESDSDFCLKLVKIITMFVSQARYYHSFRSEVQMAQTCDLVYSLKIVFFQNDVKLIIK